MTHDVTGHLYKKDPQDDNKRVAPPSHRHAAPSAPWPWINISDDVDQKQLETEAPPVPEPCSHHPSTCENCWTGYPKSLYPNWTSEQVGKSKIQKAIDEYRRDVKCVLYQVDVDEDGLFKVPEEGKIESDDSKLEDTWSRIVNTNIPHDNRVRALFVENMSGPVLQMLGAKYNIEPFFFSSSINWIPSRYQEQIKPGEGDHITICLTFLRSVPDGGATSMSAASPYDNESANGSGNIRVNTRAKRSNPNASTSSTSTLRAGSKASLTEQMIDTQAPLVLKSNGRLLVLDLLSVHLIRRAQGSVIISYHADKDLPTTTAPYLHTRIRFAGQSVYWQSIFQSYSDPTFVLLTFIWHALYAWDEALENLYSHICSLESRVITTSEMALTQELHVIRAHHMHYSSLLDDFIKTVEFIRDTTNPVLEALSDSEREANAALLNRECDNLLMEIVRLEAERKMQERRLKNVLNLVFSSVNILDSRRMQKMTEAASNDSAAVSPISSYLGPRRIDANQNELELIIRIDEANRLFNDGVPPSLLRSRRLWNECRRNRTRYEWDTLTLRGDSHSVYISHDMDHYCVPEQVHFRRRRVDLEKACLACFATCTNDYWVKGCDSGKQECAWREGREGEWSWEEKNTSVYYCYDYCGSHGVGPEVIDGLDHLQY